MATNRIDFVSEYCDRWCERCAFTDRCSAYAVEVALAMCDGDFREALELAVGRPQPVRGRKPPSRAESLPDELFEEISDKELEEISRELDARHERVAALPVTQAAIDYGVAAWRWLNEHEGSELRADPRLHEAVNVLGWDSHLIGVKLRRALDGKDEYQRGNPADDDRVQNDWNGSAKLTLLLIERSTENWGVVHSVLGDEGAAVLEESLKKLACAVRSAFPEAMAFRRPGFDAK